MTVRKAAATTLLASSITALLVAPAAATEPCGDFGECKALIEINSTDGDIGFHFLMDGDELNSARINDPDGAKVFEDQAKGPLLEQKLTETFAESAEPLCWDDPEADEDEDIVTLAEFLDVWAEGTYTFSGMSESGEKSEGETELTYEMPAAPIEVDFDGSTITWGIPNGTLGPAPIGDLGNCASAGDLTTLVAEGILTTHPADVTVHLYEAVMETDVEDDDPRNGLKFTIRVPAGVTAVTVPAEYLSSLGADTPVKVEVGAIGGEDNATFTEEDGFCVNEDEGCD